MRKKSILILFMVIFLLLGIYNILIEGEAVLIKEISSEKVRYLPGETIEFNVSFEMDKKSHFDGKYEIQVSHLNQNIDNIKDDITLTKDESESIKINWKAPKEDFKGYLVKFDLINKFGKVISTKTFAIDVSSDWRKFPRYGFITNFDKDANVSKILEDMRNLQLNSLEFYDWKYLHHQPLPENGEMKWEDWAGRKIDGNIVKEYILKAREKNMISMSYNMIYAATNNYEEYGIKDEWGLWFAENHPESNFNKGDRFKFHMGMSPSGQSDLFFFDIENKEWQNYIINKNIAAIESMGFDGWHGDSVGEWGKMWTYSNIGNDKQTKLVKEGYKVFLNEAKDRLKDKYLSFNPVGAQGIEEVNSSNVDILYAEIWPWDKDSEGNTYNNYMSLKREIDRSRLESKGKSLTIAAYMQYDYAQIAMNKEFNISAVLLTDAAVYAAGGSRIELGDGNQMLSNEYFPKKNLKMSKEHLEKQINMQNFIVAYQNLLRDGLEDNNKKIEIIDKEVSEDGKPNTIWTYSKENENYETIQLINLNGVTTDDWRANEGKKEKPQMVENFVLKYYTDRGYESAWITSPDDLFKGETIELVVENGNDENGNYVSVNIPSLEYWDMVYFIK